MDNKEFAKELEKRTREFAVAIIHLPSKLPNTPEAIVIRNQVTKSGTSIGANYVPCSMIGVSPLSYFNIGGLCL